MTDLWLEITLTIPVDAIDLVGQALMEIGCCGITVAEEQLDTFEVPDGPALHGPTQPIRAFFPEPHDRQQLSDAIQAALADLVPVFPALDTVTPVFRSVRNEDWASGWQQHFPPLQVGDRLTIRPSWIDTPPPVGHRVLTMDPGRAFGTGTHATTTLCLQALAQHIDACGPPARVLDVGTGSGILAMAAAALGTTRVLACDIDPESCEVARENIDRNRLQDRVIVTDRLLEELDGTYDLIFANILANENIRLAPYFLARLAPAGELLLSGILIEQEESVIRAFSAFPVSLRMRMHREEWTCLVYVKHA